MSHEDADLTQPQSTQAEEEEHKYALYNEFMCVHCVCGCTVCFCVCTLCIRMYMCKNKRQHGHILNTKLKLMSGRCVCMCVSRGDEQREAMRAFDLLLHKTFL